MSKEIIYTYVDMNIFLNIIKPQVLSMDIGQPHISIATA